MGDPRYFNKTRPRPQADKTIHRARILLVEGPDDIFFFDQLMAQLGADQNQCQIIDYEGKDNLSRILPLLAKDVPFRQGNVTHLGIVQDADGNRTAANQRIRGACSKAGLSPPTFGDFGMDTNMPGLLVGAFTLPDCQSDGDLDSLLFSSVAGSSAHAAAVTFLGSVVPAPLGKIGKRSVQTYLAAQEKLVRGAGNGALHGYFNLDAEELAQVRDFIQKFIA